MRLTDLVSGADLDTFASVSLTIFLVVFAAVVIRALAMPKGAARAASRAALDDDTPLAQEPRDG